MGPEATRLTVRVPELADAESALVEVRDGQSRVVARPRCGVPVELNPGLYVASVMLASGRHYRGVFELAPQEPLEVVLGPEQPAASTVAGYALSPEVVAADLAGSTVAPEASAEAAAPTRCWVRLVSGANGKPLDAPPLRQLEPSCQDDGPCIELEYQAIPHDGVVLAQVAVPGVVPQNVALPAAPQTPIASCRVSVVLGSQRVAVSALPASRTSTALIASYLVTGNLRTAANAAEDAEQMLASEHHDPVGAVLGAYALLRLGRGEHLQDEPSAEQGDGPRLRLPLRRHRGLPDVDVWLRELALRCEWLPDGAIVAGELARRNGRDSEADFMVATALRRGLPMFSDGLSLLVSDVRSHTPNLTVRRRADRLLSAASFADYSQLCVVLPGLDPTRADDGAVDAELLSAEQGWQPFDTPR